MPCSVEEFSSDVLREIIDLFPGGRRMFREFTGISQSSLQNYLAQRTVPSQYIIDVMAQGLGINGDCFSNGALTEKMRDKVRNVIRRRYEKIKINNGVIKGDVMKVGKKLNWKDAEVPYPYNLIDAICKEHVDVVLTEDQLGGVQIAIETLAPREQQVLEKRYKDYMTLLDTGKEFGVTLERTRQIEAKALRKLRHPSRMKYIKLGLSGIERYGSLQEIENEISEKQKYKEELERKIEDAEMQLYKLTFFGENTNLATKKSFWAKNYRSKDIAELDFSVRTFKCLYGSGIRTVGELIDTAVDELRLHRIRNMGNKSIREIYDKLWKLYHIDPREKGLEDGEKYDNAE